MTIRSQLETASAIGALIGAVAAVLILNSPHAMASISHAIGNFRTLTGGFSSGDIGINRPPSLSPLTLSSRPKLFRGVPQHAGKNGNNNASGGGKTPVVLIDKDKETKDTGRDSVPIDTIVWWTILALCAYFGKSWAEYRYLQIVKRQR